MAGILFLCATPIGNLEDITMRVLRTLREVDVIAAEDTRQTIKLLNHYEIRTPLVSYHEHNKREKTGILTKRLLGGENMALVTDAGTPAISDPGEDLVRACYDAGIEVTSLPGASAVITALALSGMSARRFTFEGFLPADKKERASVLERFAGSTCTTIFYEAPHRLVQTLRILAGAAGSDRPAAICRELTKRHEESVHYTLGEAAAYYEEHQPKGEFVLVVGGADPERQRQERQQEWREMSLEQHMQLYLSEGMDRKSAMKAVAKDRGVPKREIYAALLPE